jgi:hypothetical protein
MEEREGSSLYRRQLLALAAAHIRHFTRQLTAGNRGDDTVRLDETGDYLETWRRAHRDLEAGKGFAELQPEARTEIQDAIDCGDYDDLLDSYADAAADA